MSDLLYQMGTRLMNRRKELRLSQEAVAEQAGLSLQTISSAERGRKALRPENIVKLSEVLDITPDFILLGKQSSDPYRMLSGQISALSPQEKYHLEQIIDNYLAAVMAIKDR